MSGAQRPIQIIPSVLPADWAAMGQCEGVAVVFEGEAVSNCELVYPATNDLAHWHGLLHVVVS